MTRHPREGNPEPRWYPASYREALENGECIFLNSIGLTNPGIEAAVTSLAPEWAQQEATVRCMRNGTVDNSLDSRIGPAGNALCG